MIEAALVQSSAIPAPAIDCARRKHPMQKWLSIVGIGEDGLSGLSPSTRSLIEHAEVLVGGERHLAMLPPDDSREKLSWTAPIAASINEVLRRRGQPMCVLASGDPMCYGIGVTLTRRL